MIQTLYGDTCMKLLRATLIDSNLLQEKWKLCGLQSGCCERPNLHPGEHMEGRLMLIFRRHRGI